MSFASAAAFSAVAATVYVGSVDSVDAMASNKRARSSIAQVADVKVEELQLKSITGGALIIDAARQILRLNLTPTGSIPNRFGFQTYGGEPRPFMRGEAVGRRNDGMSITLQIAGDLVDQLEALDRRCCELYMASLPENDKKPQWKSLVKDYEGDKLVKVAVNLVGEDCASLAVQPREGGDAASGSGWAFLQPLLKPANYFRHADTKAVVKLARVWTYNGYAGVKLLAQQLRMRPAEVDEAEEEDPFADAEDW
jgi:hypothetical protein